MPAPKKVEAKKPEPVKLPVRLTDEELDQLKVRVSRAVDASLSTLEREGYLKILDAIDELRRSERIHELLTKGRNTLKGK